MSDEIDPATTTVAEAQAILRDQVDEGATCPVCTQHAKVYRRRVNKGMAQALRLIARAASAKGDPRLPVHVPSEIGRRSAEEGKLALFGLIEQSPSMLADEQPNAAPERGWWRMTSVGLDFLRIPHYTIPRYVRVYDGRALGFVDESDRVTFLECLAEPFDYTLDVEGVGR